MNTMPGALATVLCALIFANTLVAGTDPVQVGAEVAGAGPKVAMVYLDPPTIEATEAGQNVNVSIRVVNATFLYAFTVGLMWDPNALEFVNLTKGDFLGEKVISIAGTLDNNTGEIFPPYAFAKADPNDPRGKSGDGVLAYATFRAKAAGHFNVYLAEVCLGDDGDWGVTGMIPAQVVNVFATSMTKLGVEIFYNVTVMSNMTSDRARQRITAIDERANEIRFNITANPYLTYISGGVKRTNVTGGLCSVDIPEGLLRKPEGGWKVLLNGKETPYTETVWQLVKYPYVPPPTGDEEDGGGGGDEAELEPLVNMTMTTLGFNFPLGNYEVQIIGESPPRFNYMPLLVAGVVAAVALVAVVALWKKGLLRRR